MSIKRELVGDGYSVKIDSSLNCSMACIFLCRKRVLEKAVEECSYFSRYEGGEILEHLNSKRKLKHGPVKDSLNSKTKLPVPPLTQRKAVSLRGGNVVTIDFSQYKQIQQSITYNNTYKTKMQTSVN